MSNGIKSITVNSDWLYHRVTPLTIEKIILSGAIKSKRLLSSEEKKEIEKREHEVNGEYYISLAKNIPNILYHSSYHNFIKGQYALVINDVDAIKCKYIEDNFSFYQILCQLPIKKRYSWWQDEFQVKDSISLDKAIGIKIPSKEPIFSSYCYDYGEDRGINFFLESMSNVDFNLPFIDVEEEKMIEKAKIKEYILERQEI